MNWKLTKSNSDRVSSGIGISQRRGRRFGSLTLIDRLFGYDFFLSYAHADGQNYVILLKKELEGRRFRVCVDLAEFTAGDSIGETTQRRVGMSRRLVLICRPAALRSTYVRQEVEAFIAKGGRPITIDWMNSLSTGDAFWLRDLVKDDLYIAERSPNVDGPPSEAVLDSLQRSFTIRRTETIRVYILRMAAASFLAIAAGAVFFGWRAKEEARDAWAGRFSAESAFERPRNLRLSIAKALCAINQSALTSAIDALVAAVQSAGPATKFLKPLGVDALDLVFVESSDLVAVATEAGTIAFLNLRKDTREDLPVFSSRVTALGLVRDRQALVAGSGEGELAIIDLKDRTVEHITSSRHQAGITKIVGIGGEYFATTGWDNNLRLWSYKSKSAEVVCSPPPAHISGNIRTGISGAAIDEKRQILFSVGGDGRIGAWDVSNPSQCHLLTSYQPDKNGSAFSSVFTSVAVNKHSGLIAVGTYDGALNFYVFDNSAGTFRDISASNLDGAQSLDRAIEALEFDESGDRLFVARSDSTLTLWSTAQREGGDPHPSYLQAWRAHGGPISAARRSLDGLRIGTAAGGQIILWDVALSKILVERLIVGNEVRTVTSSSGEYLVSWNEDNQFATLSVLEAIGSSRQGQSSAAGRVVAAAISEDGQQVALGTEFGEVELHIFGKAERLLVNDQTERHAEVTALELAKDGLVVGLRDGEVTRYSVVGDTLVGARLYTHEGSVTAIRVNSDRELIASSPSRLGAVTIQNLAAQDGMSLAKVPLETSEAVRGLALSPNRKLLAIASSLGRIRLVDFQTDTPTIRDLSDPGEQVRSVSFSRDGNTLASVADGTSVTFWNIKDGQRLFVIPNAVLKRADSIRFHRDGRVILIDTEGNLLSLRSSVEGWRHAADQIGLHQGASMAACSDP